MAYSGLTILPAVSISTDGLQIIVTDNTVYAATGLGTAIFPTFAQSQRWVIYRKSPFTTATVVYYPSSQVAGGPPWPGIVIPTEDGNIYQIFLLVVPSSLSYGLDFIDIFASASIQAAVQWAITNYGVGTLPVIVGQANVNCLNESRREYVNSIITGDCLCEDFDTKNSIYQGVVSTMNTYGNSSMLSATQTALYTEAQEQLALLTATCAQLPCC